MPSTPAWEAARNGLPGHVDSTNHAGQIGQFLGSHDTTIIRQGPAMSSPNGLPGFYWIAAPSTADLDQQITMPGGQSELGRVTLPIRAFGNGADVKVTLSADSGGKPTLTSPIASATIPAQWLVNQGAPNGLTDATTSPMALARDNTLALVGLSTYPWTQPNSTSSGAASAAASLTSGNYIVLLGGAVGATAVATAATVQWGGGTSLGLPQPQTPLPQAAYYGAVAATKDTIMYAGGQDGGTYYSSVYTASWDPNTGTIGSWSSQASLPTTLTLAGGAAHASTGTLYIVGGTTDGTSANAQSFVYYATPSNGAIGAWQQGARMPQPLHVHVTAVVGDWLIVAGGLTQSSSVSPWVYYSHINPDGSLSGWQYGPLLPTPIWTNGPGWDVATTDSAIVLVGGNTDLIGGTTNAVQLLTTTPEDIGAAWTQQRLGVAGTFQAALFSTGANAVSNEGWQLTILHSGSYDTTAVYPIPVISVPLGATGLTPGGTYHITYQQIQGATQDDYTNLGIQAGALPNADATDSFRFRNTWFTLLPGYQVPITLYGMPATGRPIHTISDVGYYGDAGQISTINFAHNYRMLGLYEATRMPADPLNANPTFTTGVSPWTWSGGTLTQSSAQVHGGYAYSGLLTPSGSASTVSALSEAIPVTGGTWYAVQAWVYSPTGWSQVSLSRVYLDSTGTQISSYDTVQSVPAATWTQIVLFVQADAGASFARLQPKQLGTPGVSNLLYLSYVTLTPTFPAMLPSVAQVTYPDGSTSWPPTGITQLA